MSTQPAVATTSGNRPVKMSLRQRLLVSGVVDGKSIAQAGRDAGYRSRHNAHDSLRDARDKLPALLQKHGLDADSILERLRDKLDATKTVTASAFGEITDSIEIADNPTQIKAIEIAADLHGWSQRESGVSIGTVNVLWAGTAPPWANGQALPNSNANSIDSENVIESSTNGVDTQPEVQLKVLGSDPAGSTQTNSKTLANRMVKTPNRQVKKRGPRLPVYKGDK